MTNSEDSYRYSPAAPLKTRPPTFTITYIKVLLITQGGTLESYLIFSLLHSLSNLSASSLMYSFKMSQIFPFFSVHSFNIDQITYYASGTTLDTGNAGTKDTVPALNEYFLPEKTDKKITHKPIIPCRDMHKVSRESRGGRRTQPREPGEDFLRQPFVSSETPQVRAKVKSEDIGNNTWKTVK